MCWVSKEKPVKKVAKEDMKVFKILNVCNDVISSPIYTYNNVVWKHGETTENNLEAPKFAYDMWRATIGLHSLRVEPKVIAKRVFGFYGTFWHIGNEILFFKQSNSMVLTCVIPKGAEYYENKDGEIVSNKLMLI